MGIFDSITGRDYDERIDHIFQSIELMDEDQFTDRELEILESLEEQYNRVSLSPGQIDLLEKIYRRAQSR